jgi:hypothetical protein
MRILLLADACSGSGARSATTMRDVAKIVRHARAIGDS